MSRGLPQLFLVVIIYGNKAKYAPEYAPEDGTD